MSFLITSLDQITPEWLTETLQENGHLSEGVVVAVDKVAGKSLVSNLAFLKVAYSATAPATSPKRLFLKYTRADLEIALPYVGKKETEFYNNIARQMNNPPLARCFGAKYDPESGQYQIILEDLSESYIAYPLSQLPPTYHESQQIIEALTRFQAYWWDHPTLGKEIGKLPSEETLAGFGRWTEKITPAFYDFIGDRLSAERRKIYEAVPELLLPKLAERLLRSRNITIFHGDTHIGNFLIPREPDQASACIIDWDGWGVDLGLGDLAAMIAMLWFPERRARFELPLLQRYHQRLLEFGVKNYNWDQCWYDYRLAVCRMIFAPLGQWAMKIPADFWWNNLERIMLAFQDLNCMELLS